MDLFLCLFLLFSFGSMIQSFWLLCRYEIDKVTAGQRLDLNLERGYGYIDYTSTQFKEGKNNTVWSLTIAVKLQEDT